MDSDQSNLHEQDTQQEDLRNAGIAGAASSTVGQYGSAIKQHFVAFSGHDYETGQTLTKGLKDIASSKVNPQYQKQNLRQQSGFSAEVKESARYNAQKILEGSAERKVRTDDLGRVNDPLCDHVTLDSNGNIVSGSGAQMKFVGSTPKEAIEKLTSTKSTGKLASNLKFPLITMKASKKKLRLRLKSYRGSLPVLKRPNKPQDCRRKLMTAE